MKIAASILFCLYCTQTFGQDYDIFDQLLDQAYIFNGKVVQGTNAKSFKSNLEEVHGSVESFERLFEIEVNSKLNYEAGHLVTERNEFEVMFLKRKDLGTTPKVEFLIIFPKVKSSADPKGIDEFRDKWIELCNAHDAETLAKELYTSDANYYSRERLIQGTESISNEYSYMNNPNYSLKLTPKFVQLVSTSIVYEIGRCSGSYPNPYMIVWQKQEDERWQVLLDTNY